MDSKKQQEEEKSKYYWSEIPDALLDEKLSSGIKELYLWFYRWSKSEGNYIIVEMWRALSPIIDESDPADCTTFRLTNSRYYLYIPEISRVTGIQALA